MPHSLPIAVLVSGSGTNLQALIEASDGANSSYEIVAVVADRPDAGGLFRAQSAGIPTDVVLWEDHDDRTSFSAAICDAAQGRGAAVLVLAGFMRILASVAIERFPDAIVNVHPALLPAFPGADAVEQSLAYGVTVTGVTVHFVDEKVDHGPIIAQEAVEIEHLDDAASLHARIQAVEHRLLPEVVTALARGEIKVHGREVQWLKSPGSGPR
ncbi:MAG: phosphoribosylglycinamide formyltransferase [Acidimicrobiia bacterium]